MIGRLKEEEGDQNVCVCVPFMSWNVFSRANCVFLHNILQCDAVLERDVFGAPSVIKSIVRLKRDGRCQEIIK